MGRDKKQEPGRKSCHWVSCFTVPLERRLQTLACLCVFSLFFVTIALNLVVLWYWRTLGAFYALYLGWIFLFDRNAHLTGGRTPIGRRWSLWKLFRNYFPSEICSEVGQICVFVLFVSDFPASFASRNLTQSRRTCSQYILMV